MKENLSSDPAAQSFIISAGCFLSDEYLPKIEHCISQLSHAQVWHRFNPVSNSVGNLVLHLCGNARQWIVSGVGQQPDYRQRNAEFADGQSLSKEELLELLRSTVKEVVQVLKEVDPSTLLEPRHIQGRNVDMLEAIFHATEHFSMHTGQIILLTKMLSNTDLRFYDFSSGAPQFRW